MNGVERVRGLCAAGVFLVLAWTAAGAARADGYPVVWTVQADAQANVGGVAEVSVALDYGATAPASVVLFVSYETARLAPATSYYEVIVRNLNGGPVRDLLGNVVTRSTAVFPDPALAAAGKMVEAEYVAPLAEPAGRGLVGVVITGLNSTPLPRGALLTLAFTVREANFVNDTVPVFGVDADRPAVHGSRVLASSASAASGQRLDVAVNDGLVSLGCEGPAAPANVAASTDRTADVRIAWDAEEGMEYRVLRALPGSPARVTALGEGWVTGGSFIDITAPAPDILNLAGCFRLGSFRPELAFYSVKARAVGDNCESVPSEPVEGYRAAANSSAVLKGTALSGAVPPSDGRRLAATPAPGGMAVLGLMLACLAAAARGGRPRVNAAPASARRED